MAKIRIDEKINKGHDYDNKNHRKNVNPAVFMAQLGRERQILGILGPALSVLILQLLILVGNRLCESGYALITVTEGAGIGRLIDGRLLAGADKDKVMTEGEGNINGILE